MTKFIFDLDGTITSEETLPIISKHFNIHKEIDEITARTVQGEIPFVESFTSRVHILSMLPIDEVDELLEKVSLYPKVLTFIHQNKDNCAIATGNLRCWIDKLVKRIGCACFSSDALIENNNVIKLTNILRKEKIVEYYKNFGEKVVFIGDGHNDVEAMKVADYSIASGLTHPPAKSIVEIADYLVYCEDELYNKLNELL